MENWQTLISITTFLCVIFFIMTEWVHLTIATLLGALLLVFTNAMMFGATLGGNGTLVGASSNIVAAGVSEQHGRRISFKTFLHYGIPVMVLQLITSAIYVFFRFLRA